MQQPLPSSLNVLLSVDNTAPSIEPIVGGLIHHTYRVAAGNQSTLLQSINTQIFSDPIGLIKNHQALYQHFRSPESPFSHPLAKPLAFPNGEWLYVDEFQQTWRQTEFINGSYTLSAVEDPNQAFALAAFFARFTKYASTLDHSHWYIPLPHFHDLSFRYEQLEQAIQEDRAGQKNMYAQLIDDLRGRQHYVKAYGRIRQNPAFTWRMMHHDAKLSNVLIDEKEHTWLCPIDLDTVMPGYFFSDLGDMIRSICNGSGKEDSAAQQVQFRSDLFESLLDGYRSGMQSTLSSLENQLLPIAGVWMTYMQCLRFTTDLLQGDLYYRIERRGQNAERAENQLELLRQMENYLEQSGRGSLLAGEIV